MNYLDEAVTKSLDEFMEYYKVVDTEEIYSNGTEFVPIFRVKQWEEYNNKDKEIERLNNIINRTTKYVQGLSSKGRGCDIYEDIKQEILKELKGSDSDE